MTTTPSRSMRLGLFLAFLIAADAHAVCMNGFPTVEKEYANSETVFRGRVIGARSIPAGAGFEEGTVYAIAVREVLRGKPGATVELFSENSSGRFPMTQDRDYLVFAYRDRARLSVDNCGNSGGLPASSAALAAARKIAATSVR